MTSSRVPNSLGSRTSQTTTPLPSFHVPLGYPRLPQPVARSQSFHVIILLTTLITTYYFSQINSMARPKLTLFLDVVSPFGYMAFYMTRVWCSPFNLFYHFRPNAQPHHASHDRRHVVANDAIAFVLIRIIEYLAPSSLTSYASELSHFQAMRHQVHMENSLAISLTFD